MRQSVEVAAPEIKIPQECRCSDFKNLAKLKTLDANAPEAMKAFCAFNKAAMAAGAIPVSTKN